MEIELVLSKQALLNLWQEVKKVIMFINGRVATVVVGMDDSSFFLCHLGNFEEKYEKSVNILISQIFILKFCDYTAMH